CIYDDLESENQQNKSMSSDERTFSNEPLETVLSSDFTSLSNVSNRNERPV
ncbi:13622_t:CDS:1, partial [Dentiscutata erythropus]